MFTSAKSVLRRADHHIANLETEIHTLTPTKPYTYLVEDNGNGTDTHIYSFDKTFSDDMACIVFDAVNNLRTCLDQMTNAIAIRHRGPSKQWAYFPFSTCAEWKNRVNGLKNDIPAKLLALFESFDAYKGGNDTLWAINYMANIQKHAVLIPIGFGRAVIWESQPGSNTILHGAWMSEKYEIKYTAPSANRGSNLNFTYAIVISDEEEVIDGQAPVALLDLMRIEVMRIMCEAETECSRIGLFC